MNKDKAALAFAISIGLTAIMAASVATFAWFQADAQVEIQTTSETATITVQAPSDVEINDPDIYYYKGNNTGGYNGSYLDSITSEDTALTKLGANFAPVTTSAQMTISAAWPGYRKTYAVVIHATSGTISSGSMILKSYTTNNANFTNRNILSTPPSYNKIQIEEAINIYTGVNSTGVYSVSGTDSFQYSGSSLADTTILETTSFTSTTDAIFFYTVEFSNGSDTWYREVTSASSELYNTPSDSDSAGSVARYFVKDTVNGNSSCYEGMTFTITNLEFTIA